MTRTPIVVRVYTTTYLFLGRVDLPENDITTTREVMTAAGEYLAESDGPLLVEWSQNGVCIRRGEVLENGTYRLTD